MLDRGADGVDGVEYEVGEGFGGGNGGEDAAGHTFEQGVVLLEEIVVRIGKLANFNFERHKLLFNILEMGACHEVGIKRAIFLEHVHGFYQVIFRVGNVLGGGGFGNSEFEGAFNALKDAHFFACEAAHGNGKSVYDFVAGFHERFKLLEGLLA